MEDDTAIYFQRMADELRDDNSALRAEVARLKAIETAARDYLWRIRDAVMHEGGWCYDYETAEGKRIADFEAALDAVAAIKRAKE